MTKTTGEQSTKSLSSLLKEIEAEADVYRKSEVETKRLLGDVVIEFNALDHVIESLISAFLSMPGYRVKEFEFVISNLSYSQKIKILAKLARPYINKEALKGLGDIQKSLRRRGNERNRYLHAFWKVGLSEKPHAYMRGERHEIDPIVLKKVRENCKSTQHMIAEFFSDVRVYTRNV